MNMRYTNRCILYFTLSCVHFILDFEACSSNLGKLDGIVKRCSVQRRLMQTDDLASSDLTNEYR